MGQKTYVNQNNCKNRSIELMERKEKYINLLTSSQKRFYSVGSNAVASRLVRVTREHECFKLVTFELTKLFFFFLELFVTFCWLYIGVLGTFFSDFWRLFATKFNRWFVRHFRRRFQVGFTVLESRKFIRIYKGFWP